MALTINAGITHQRFALNYVFLSKQINHTNRILIPALVILMQMRFSEVKPAWKHFSEVKPPPYQPAGIKQVSRKRAEVSIMSGVILADLVFSSTTLHSRHFRKYVFSHCTNPFSWRFHCADSLQKSSAAFWMMARRWHPFFFSLQREGASHHLVTTPSSESGWFWIWAHISITF